MSNPTPQHPDFAALISEIVNLDIDDWAGTPAGNDDWPDALVENPFMAALEEAEARRQRDREVLLPRIGRDARLAVSEDLPNSYRADAALRVFVACAVLAATEFGDPDIAELETALETWQEARNRPAKRLSACRYYFLTIVASAQLADLTPPEADVWIPLKRHLAGRTSEDWKGLLRACHSLHEALQRSDANHVLSAATNAASVMDVPLRPAARRR